jgi:hypothetical protein
MLLLIAGIGISALTVIGLTLTLRALRDDFRRRRQEHCRRVLRSDSESATAAFR